jgi:hypothetical protein
MALDQLETGLPSLWEHLPVVHDELFPSRDGSNEAILSSGFLKVSALNFYSGLHPLSNIIIMANSPPLEPS